MFSHWAREYLGNEVIDSLISKHKVIIKLTKAEKKEMYAFMKEECERLKKERTDGKQGVLFFKGYL